MYDQIFNMKTDCYGSLFLLLPFFILSLHIMPGCMTGGINDLNWFVLHLIATIVLLAAYSLLPEQYRFSRAIILFGAILSFILIGILRWILDPNKSADQQ